MKLNKENVKDFLKKKGEEIKEWIKKHPTESIECATSVFGITFMTIEGIKSKRSSKEAMNNYIKRAEESNESVVNSLKQIADNTKYRG